MIDKQDKQALRIIMRGVYLKYSFNGNDNVNGQVAELNRKVLSIIVPQVLSGIAMRVKVTRTLHVCSRPWLGRRIPTS
jgi:hypothetical protein